MAEPVLFDDLESGAPARPTKPIWSIDLDGGDEKEILSWLNAEYEHLKDQNEARVGQQRRNLALYKGIQYQTQEARRDVRDRTAERSNTFKKIVSNDLYDLTKNRVARLIKYKPAVAILPTNDELQDKVSAKITKTLLDYIWYENDFEGGMTHILATNAMVMGEAYLFPKWNPNKGDLNPAYVEAKGKAGSAGKVPVMGDDGKPKKDSSGNTIYVEKPVRVGDIEYETKLASEVLLETKREWKKVNYLFTNDCYMVEEARVLWPDSASKIKAMEGGYLYDYASMQERTARNEVEVRTFWHKRTDIMDAGRMIVFTKDAILENTEFPYTHRELPCVRFTDVEFPGELHGQSFFELIKGLTGTYNNLLNLILRNQVMVSHPKWMLPKGACNLEQLANDITVVQFQGPTPPMLVQANPTPAEIFKFMEGLQQKFQQIAGISGVTAGDPPPGIKAGVALQFLAEQEAERFNEIVLKWNEFIRQIAIQTLAVAGDYYDDSDERMVRVIGKNNAWMTQFFDTAHLSKSYDIRIQNSSALPQSKAARTQTIIDLHAQFPELFSQEQVIDMLDLAQNDKFIDAATVSVRSAEAENEKLMDGDMPAEELSPKEYENHVLHWKTHARQVQEYAFKYLTPEKIRVRFEDHIRTTEMLMIEKVKVNPLYAEKLAALDGFPLFFTLEIPAAAPGGPQAPAASSAGGALADMPGMPVQGGGEAQQLAQEPLPPISTQTAGEAANVPTGAI